MKVYKDSDEFGVNGIDFCCAAMAKDILLGRVKTYPWTCYPLSFRAGDYPLSYCSHCGAKIDGNAARLDVNIDEIYEAYESGFTIGYSGKDGPLIGCPYKTRVLSNTYYRGLESGIKHKNNNPDKDFKKYLSEKIGVAFDDLNQEVINLLITIGRGCYWDEDSHNNTKRLADAITKRLNSIDINGCEYK